jgi:uncharacterized protein (TIGR02246 family)
MMRFCLFCCCAALAVFSGACSSTATVAPDNREADLQAIKATEAAWSKDTASKDINAFAKYYSDDATVLVPNAPVFHGMEAIKSGLKPMFSDPNFSLSFTGQAADVSKSGDLGYSQGSYTATMSDPKGKPMTDKGKYLTVWKKQADGSWKAVEDTFNSDLPLPGMK